MNSLLQQVRALASDRPDLLFYGAFLLALPFTWRKVFFVIEPKGFIGFNEYTDISVYIADILLIIAVGLYLIEHRKTMLSTFTRLFHVEHVFVGGILIILALISTLLSEQRLLAFYSLFRFTLFCAVFLYILFQFVPRGTSDKCSTWNFIRYTLSIVVISALMQSFISIFQFVLQSNIGLRFLGESYINTSMSGVAELIVGGVPILRSYGTFLHPNILGGFLFFAIVSLIFIKKRQLFHVEHWIFHISLILLCIAIVLSFSKSAIIALIIASFYYCSTWNTINDKVKHKNQFKIMFHVEHYYFIAIIALLLISLIIILSQERSLQSLKERALFYPVTLDIIKERPYFGLGPGQFVYKLPDYANILDNWQLQPIHNIFLLLATENGLLFSFIFFAFIALCLQNVPRGTIFGRYTFSVLIGLLFIGIFDHYLWDIVFGQYMFGIALALAAGSLQLED